MPYNDRKKGTPVKDLLLALLFAVIFVAVFVAGLWFGGEFDNYRKRRK